MAITDAQRRAHDKYFSKAYSQIKLSMPNEEADALRAFCSARGLTVAGFIRGLIRDAIAAAADPGQAYPVGDNDGIAVSGVTSTDSRENKKGDSL